MNYWEQFGKITIFSAEYLMSQNILLLVNTIQCTTFSNKFLQLHKQLYTKTGFIENEHCFQKMFFPFSFTFGKKMYLLHGGTSYIQTQTSGQKKPNKRKKNLFVRGRLNYRCGQFDNTTLKNLQYTKCMRWNLTSVCLSVNIPMESQ